MDETTRDTNRRRHGQYRNHACAHIIQSTTGYLCAQHMYVYVRTAAGPTYVRASSHDLPRNPTRLNLMYRDIARKYQGNIGIKNICLRVYWPIVYISLGTYQNSLLQWTRTTAGSSVGCRVSGVTERVGCILLCISSVARFLPSWCCFLLPPGRKPQRSQYR